MYLASKVRRPREEYNPTMRLSGKLFSPALCRPPAAVIDAGAAHPCHMHVSSFVDHVLPEVKNRTKCVTRAKFDIYFYLHFFHVGQQMKGISRLARWRSKLVLVFVRTW